MREIDDDEGRRLVRIIRRGSGSVVTWRRAQMVLLSAQGMDAAAIARVAFTSEDRVRDVIRNFNAYGFGSLYPNLAADLAAWCRLLGLYDQEDLKDAEPDTLRYRLLSLPARLVRHARARVLKISRTWPWKEVFLACWQRLCALPAPA